MTFGNALSRSSVADSLCGYSYAATTPTLTVGPLPPASLAAMAATGNGVPPSSGVQLINNLSPGLALRDLVSLSPSTFTQDFNLDGALCLRNLLTGSDASGHLAYFAGRPATCGDWTRSSILSSRSTRWAWAGGPAASAVLQPQPSAFGLKKVSPDCVGVSAKSTVTPSSSTVSYTHLTLPTSDLV